MGAASPRAGRNRELVRARKFAREVQEAGALWSGLQILGPDGLAKHFARLDRAATNRSEAQEADHVH